ncbi:hypothetical protein G6011_10061 [Alternaria panax]|uniref:ABC transporter domain-containing protein n=1 Tax=Alternaria panax TaxID=48097 RepID=A0AAD4FBL8_9PLEO|nr:hypothetical protein G6011_10061 [Alternaria panax]
MLSDHFRAKDWARSFYDLRYSSDETIPRVAGVAFRGLNVWGEGSPTDFQSTVGNTILKLPSLSGRGTQKIEILRDLDGLLLPREQLCVLRPPGSGCLTLLNAIAGETHSFEVNPDSHLNYQGVPAKGMDSVFRGEAVYTAEVDAHLPQLSLDDTLYFAALALEHRTIPGGISRQRYAENLRDVVMAMYCISHTSNTRVGNDFIRGVSGGECKRVTIAEASLSFAPLQLWDNSTSGLDSANAVEFCKTLRTLYAKRTIIEKHNRYALYHPSAEALSSMILDLPYKITNSIVVNTTLYFMSNLCREPGPYFYFLLVGFTTGLSISVFFWLSASMTKTLTQAFALSSLVLMMLVLYIGFAILIQYMQGWADWSRWINLVAYGFKSVIVNEFHNRTFACLSFVPSGPSYENVAPEQRACAVQGSQPGLDYVSGTAYVETAFRYNYTITIILFLAQLLMSKLVASERSKGEVLVFRHSKVKKTAKKQGADEEAGEATAHEDQGGNSYYPGWCGRIHQAGYPERSDGLVATDAVNIRSFHALLIVVTVFIFASTLAHLLIAGSPNEEIAGAIATLVTIMLYAFCGILAGPDDLPGLWIFMYRVNPFTHLVSSFMSTTLGQAPAYCADSELQTFFPPQGRTCSKYVSEYIEMAGGYLRDAQATGQYGYCQMDSTDHFLTPWGYTWTVFAYVSWWIGLVWTVTLCSFQVIVLAKRNIIVDYELSSAILLPLISVMTLGTTGGLIANYSVRLSASMAVPVIVTGYMCTGYAFFLALLYYAFIAHKLIAADLPPPMQIPSLVITVGPVGQFATAIQVLTSAASTRGMFGSHNQGTLLQSNAANSASAAVPLIALLALGFGFMWIIVPWYIVVEALVKRQLPSILTWWSFVFPMGVFMTGLLDLWIPLNSTAFRGFIPALLESMFIIYFVNCGGTLYRIFTKQALGVSQQREEEDE